MYKQQIRKKYMCFKYIPFGYKNMQINNYLNTLIK